MTPEIAEPFRVHNFCAGPCALPLNVLRDLSAELVDFQGTGMSLIEMSHRGAEYDAVHQDTIDRFRRVFGVPEAFSVLLLQGGATLQFAMAPMNASALDDTIGYLVSGSWGQKALEDAKIVRPNAYAAWSGAAEDYSKMPAHDEIETRPGTRFVHVTSNETIGGIRLADFPDPGVPLVADMSSDYLSRPIPWERFDVVYGGAQKNLGPAGLTVVFVRDAIMAGAPELPSYLSYATHAAADSLANTPPVFAIWATGKVLAWMEEMGGLEVMQRRAAARSERVYETIEHSDGFYRSPVNARDRSHMNIVFRLSDEEREGRFLDEAAAADLVNLKGHRSVGGIRASIYNATPDSSVDALIEFMTEFAARAR